MPASLLCMFLGLALAACSAQRDTLDEPISAAAASPGIEPLPALMLAQPAEPALPKDAPEPIESTPAISQHLVAHGDYARVFDRTRHILRDLGFILDRVDAQGGVITTQPKGSAGLATPWDRTQSGLDQELDDLFHRQQRVVRIDFVPIGVLADGAVADLRAFNGDLQARVGVALLRSYQPGKRINTGNILSTTYTEDPELTARNMRFYTVAQQQDERLAERIARRIAGE